MTVSGQATSHRHSTWLDVVVFGLAFATGITVYVVLRARPGDRSQYLITGSLVAIMILYAVLVVAVPRLRVRKDQAGDNSYYLGLLFTLVSMAFALSDFRTLTRAGASSAGVQLIIGNFGVALFTTIVGIFLRLLLHQMRIDPADLEAMTRVELTEAAERLRATLDSVTTDIGRFHLEMQQRANDVAAELRENGSKAMAEISQQSSASITKIMADTERAHQEVLGSTLALTKTLTSVAEESLGAIEKLRSIEPPPLVLTRRLEKVGAALERIAAESERTNDVLSRTQESSMRTTESTERAAAALEVLVREAREEHARMAERLDSSAKRLGEAVEPLSARLQSMFKELSHLEEQSKRSSAESMKAQQASVEVLSQLTRYTRNLTEALRSS